MPSNHPSGDQANLDAASRIQPELTRGTWSFASVSSSLCSRSCAGSKWHREALCKTLAVPIVISDVAASLHGGRLGSLGRHALPGVGRAIEVFSLPEVMGMHR